MVVLQTWMAFIAPLSRFFWRQSHGSGAIVFFRGCIECWGGWPSVASWPRRGCAVIIRHTPLQISGWRVWLCMALGVRGRG